MTGVEKLAKMCSIVKEIDQEEEAKAAANKYHNDRLKDRWAELKAVALEDTRQTEMDLGTTGGTVSSEPVVDVTPESDGGKGMKEGTHFEIADGRKKLPPAPSGKKAGAKRGSKK